MKERGIIFGAPMIRALLVGRKTVTRRIVRAPGFHRGTVLRALLEDSTARVCEAVFSTDDVETRVRCPYGFAGDLLWVREGFALSVRDPEAHERDTKNPSDWDGAAYRATYDGVGEWERYEEDGTRSKIPPPWRSPLFMPRWASRIELEVVSVRIERLHDLTEEDAIAEGIERSEAGTFYVRDDDGELAEFASARTAFEFGWDGLHAKRGGWAANPWVWRIEFRRVEGGVITVAKTRDASGQVRKEGTHMINDAYEMGVLADELRRVRKNPPETIGEAVKSYAEALERAKGRGVDLLPRLLIGEMLWLELRPMEEKDVIDELGAVLDRGWEVRERDLASVMGRSEPCAPAGEVKP